MKKKLMALLLSLAMATSAVPEAMTFAADTSVAEATETEESPNRSRNHRRPHTFECFRSSEIVTQQTEN